MPDEVDFIPEGAPSSGTSELSKKELEMFGKAQPKPNSMRVPLWGSGHISFDPDSSVSVFALLSLVLLLICVLILTLLGIWVEAAEWMNSIFTALGHAIVGVVGAIVGSSVGSNKSEK